MTGGFTLVGDSVQAAALSHKVKGHIKITGEAGDLDQAIVEQEGECGHMIIATLGDLLNQSDYAGLDYEDGLENATVTCKVLHLLPCFPKKCSICPIQNFCGCIDG